MKENLFSEKGQFGTDFPDVKTDKAEYGSWKR